MHTHATHKGSCGEKQVRKDERATSHSQGELKAELEVLEGRLWNRLEMCLVFA